MKESCLRCDPPRAVVACGTLIAVLVMGDVMVLASIRTGCAALLLAAVVSCAETTPSRDRAATAAPARAADDWSNTSFSRFAPPRSPRLFAVSSPLASSAPRFSTPTPDMLGASAAALRNAQQSTVIILATLRSPLSDTIMSGYGSGVIVAKEGWIVTNYHVVDGPVQQAAWRGEPARVKVILPTVDARGRVTRRPADFPAVVYRVEPSLDLALLKLERPPADLPSVRLAASPPEVGATCYRIGSPAETVPWIIRSGVVSSVIDWPDGQFPQVVYGMSNGVFPALRVKAGVVITDAACGGGDSGGPTINEEGQLIGLTFAGPKAEVLSPIGCSIHRDHLDRLLRRLPAQPDVPPIDFFVGGYPHSTRGDFTPFDIDADGTPDVSACDFFWADPSARASRSFAALWCFDVHHRNGSSALADDSDDAARAPVGLWGVDADTRFRYDAALFQTHRGEVAIGYPDESGRLSEVRYSASLKPEADMIWKRAPDGAWRCERPRDRVPLLDGARLDEPTVQAVGRGSSHVASFYQRLAP